MRRVLKHADRRPVRLGRRRFLMHGAVLMVAAAFPAGLIRGTKQVKRRRIRGYRRLHVLTDAQLYGPNPYAG